jgi:hypothetical protein
VTYIDVCKFLTFLIIVSAWTYVNLRIARAERKRRARQRNAWRYGGPRR